MNNNPQRMLNIDIKDLLYVMLRKVILIFLTGIVVSGVIFCYKYFSSTKDSSKDFISFFDLSTKLPDETDVKYSERALDVNRAIDIINSIDVLKQQIENNRDYVSDSVFMQINPENEAVTTANLILNLNSTQSTKTDLALVSTYKQYILSGEYLTSFSEEKGIKQGYLTELITVNYENSTLVINSSGDSGNVGVITITIIGPTIEFTDELMDLIVESIDNKNQELDKTVISHNVSFASRQSSYKVDTITRDKQISVTNRFENLQQQINNYDKSLENLASKYNIDKSKWYGYLSFKEVGDTSSSISIKTLIKYIVLGFILGVFIALVIISLKYLFSNKFSTQTNFFSRYPNVKKIGVLRPLKKRSRFVSFVDKLSGDDSKLSDDIAYSLLVANIKNITKDMNNILFTGTAEADKVVSLIKKLDVKADVKPDFFSNPKILESISNYDGVILVEQRNFSDCRVIDEELILISNSCTKLLGAIVI